MDSQKTYLALGDSYTIGEGVDPTGNFPSQLVQMLRQEGMPIAAPEIIATTGWTTGELLTALEKTPPLQPQYTFVSLLIGVNNQYRNQSQQNYEEEFDVLLKKAIQWAGSHKRVVVLSIPDYGYTPAENEKCEQITRQINEFNLINFKIAQHRQVQYMDVTPDSRLGMDAPDMLAGDKLHPSARMYRLWAQKLVPIIKNLFHE